jgi:hypothetical protein
MSLNYLGILIFTVFTDASRNWCKIFVSVSVSVLISLFAEVMPSLTLFGRKWLVASDDLVFPGIFEFVFRFIW